MRSESARGDYVAAFARRAGLSFLDFFGEIEIFRVFGVHSGESRQGGTAPDRARRYFILETRSETDDKRARDV